MLVWIVLHILGWVHVLRLGRLLLILLLLWEANVVYALVLKLHCPWNLTRDHRWALAAALLVAGWRLPWRVHFLVRNALLLRRGLLQENGLIMLLLLLLRVVVEACGSRWALGHHGLLFHWFVFVEGVVIAWRRKNHRIKLLSTLTNQEGLCSCLLSISETHLRCQGAPVAGTKRIRIPLKSNAATSCCYILSLKSYFRLPVILWYVSILSFERWFKNIWLNDLPESAHLMVVGILLVSLALGFAYKLLLTKVDLWVLTLNLLIGLVIRWRRFLKLHLRHSRFLLFMSSQILSKLPSNKLVFVRNHDLLDGLKTVNDDWVHGCRILKVRRLELPVLRHHLLDVVQIDVVLVLDISVCKEIIHNRRLIYLVTLLLGRHLLLLMNLRVGILLHHLLSNNLA